MAGKDSFQKKTLKKVLKKIRPYTPLVIISLIFAVITVALTLYFLFLQERQLTV